MSCNFEETMQKEFSKHVENYFYTEEIYEAAFAQRLVLSFAGPSMIQETDQRVHGMCRDQVFNDERHKI